jgi:hypothetical protein
MDGFPAQAARESAYLRGREDHARGLPLSANPYRARRTASGDDWAHAWERGWHTAARLQRTPLHQTA